MHEQNLISRLAAGPKEIANISRGLGTATVERSRALVAVREDRGSNLAAALFFDSR